MSGEEPRWSWRILLLLTALLPAGFGLGAGLIAEDATILGYVSRQGALGDWTGSQYGLQLVLFWRPVVTTSWWLQELLFGTSVVGLRSLNVLTHAGCALLAAGIVARLGGSNPARLVACALVSLFPYQGGTVTWIAGRVDTLSGFFVMLTAWTALGRRPTLAALPALLACASKEVAFAVPAWVLALRWAAGDDGRALVRNAGPTIVAVVLAFVWRRLAIGIWTGGYPVSPTELLGAAPEITLALALGCAPILVGLVAAVLLGRVAGGLHGRLFAAGLACAAVSFLPIAPMLTTGVLEPQNERWLFVGDMGLALACAAGLVRPSTKPAAKALVAVLVALVLWRSWESHVDRQEWVWAAQEADLAEARARELLADAPPDERPVLFDFFPTSYGGAYCLGFGAADRFRAPFEATPRPAWPWRPLFGQETSRRAPAAPLRADGSLWPFDDSAPVAALRVEFEGESLVLDGRTFLAEVDESPKLQIAGSFPDAGFELVVYTELGYEPAPCPLDPSANTRALSLMQAMGASNGITTAGQALAQAADVGATRAYLELRVVDATGRLQAASPWIPITWDRSLVEALR